MITQLELVQSINEGNGFIHLKLDNEDRKIEIGEFLSIGRDRANSQFLNDPFVSNRHARIEKKQNGYLLKDMRSRNGTFLNGIQIIEAWLHPGDKFLVGKTEIIFCNQESEPTKKQKLHSKNSNWKSQLEKLPIIATSEFSVLITGPTGCGKDILAQSIHLASKCRKGPFVSVNCSALSPSLVESELFGHVKGSFTGAQNSRKGSFETARDGTLFLDEIGDLPEELQPKLLRALENNEIKPVGSDKVIETNVRVISATSRDLWSMVENNEFRKDLFYRLNVLNLCPPALKDRLEDFDSLIYQFCKEFRIRFSFLGIQEMKKYDWPGNIRELKNVIARASVLFKEQTVDVEQANILLDQIRKKTNNSQPNFDAGSTIKSLERELIMNRLKVNHGNQRLTAQDLRLPSSTLHDRIRAYNINVKNFKNA